MPLTNIKLKIKYTNRYNSLDIRAMDGETLLLKVPKGYSTIAIHKLLKREQTRVLRLLADAANRYTSIDYQSGSRVLFMGGEITLQFRDMHGLAWSFLKAEQSLLIEQKLLDQAESVMKDFYEQQADYLKTRCMHLAQLHGFSPKTIKLRWNTSLWGSCTFAGNISLNRGLILAPTEIQDYIILHELCHLQKPDHSQEFYAILKKLDPEYKEHVKWLRENGWKLRYFPAS